MMSTEVVTKAKPMTLKAWLHSDQLRTEIAKVLPQHMSAERMLRIATTCLTRVPKLNDCTTESFIKCLLDLSAWGLEPNGRDAHLIPYGRECTLIIDYKGLVSLAYRSGSVKKIHADVVRHGDVFQYELGEVKQHVPWVFRNDLNKPSSAGEVIAAYCHVVMADGIVKDEVMTTEEIESIRNRSRAGQSGPWKTDWCEMAKKTAFRRATKWLPLSPELVDAFERDGDKVIEATASLVEMKNRTEHLESKLDELLAFDATEVQES